MHLFPYPRVTPWVGRLIIANAVVLLLLETLFTSPALVGALRFDPEAAFREPWTFLTYMFVHGGLLHLVGNTLGLFIFGPAVESKMGGRQFITFYLLCGVGAAVFALAMLPILPSAVNPFVGASGAILGVAIAFAMFWPDTELVLFPIPIPMRARTLAIGLVGFQVVMMILGPRDGVSYVAHVGGAICGYLYFRVRTIARPRAVPPPRPTAERVVMVQSGPSEPERSSSPVTPIRQRRRIEADPVTAEIDRVLDKISAQGMSSLTADERQFLIDMSAKKKATDDSH